LTGRLKYECNDLNDTSLKSLVSYIINNIGFSNCHTLPKILFLVTATTARSYSVRLSVDAEDWFLHKNDFLSISFNFPDCWQAQNRQLVLCYNTALSIY